MITNPSSINASRGDNVTFTCHTDAGPNTTYLWLYNIVDVVCIQSDCSRGIFAFNASSQGKLYKMQKLEIIVKLIHYITDILNRTLAVSSYLSFTDVNAYDGGEYTCVAFNEAGIGISTSMLNFPPQIFEQPMDAVVKILNESVFLNCRAEAFPPPQYQWQKRDSETLNFVDLMGENSEIFAEEYTEYSHAGAYRCIVSNVINDVVNTAVSRVAIIHGL